MKRELALAGVSALILVTGVGVAVARQGNGGAVAVRASSGSSAEDGAFEQPTDTTAAPDTSATTTLTLPLTTATTVAAPVVATATAPRVTTTTAPRHTFTITPATGGASMESHAVGTGCAGHDYGVSMAIFDPSGQEVDGTGMATYPDGSWNLMFHYPVAGRPTGRYKIVPTCVISSPPGGTVFKYEPNYFTFTG